MKPVKTIGNILTSPKDPIAEHEKSRLVYKIPCADCEFVYVGQTKRDLKSRVAEHKRAVKNAEPEISALCEHLCCLIIVLIGKNPLFYNMLIVIVDG